jgi:type IV secretory pathway ATPase VirB11/archaellum biosynthesis ATPase
VVKTRDTTESADAVKPAGQPRPQRGSGRGVAATARRREGEEMRVLQMLEQGKITPQDAADLIAALQGSSSPHFDEPDDEEPPVFT